MFWDDTKPGTCSRLIFKSILMKLARVWSAFKVRGKRNQKENDNFSRGCKVSNVHVQQRCPVCISLVNFSKWKGHF